MRYSSFFNAAVFASLTLLSNELCCWASPTPPLDQVQSIAEDSSSSASQRRLSQKPIYAIAHRVLTAQGVKDAFANGANAIETDMTAWRDGWYADHDGTLTSYGDKVEVLFKAIADEKRNGKPVTFVWLDLKNPDYCDPNSNKWRHCSIAALQDLARSILQPAGIRVLYG